MRADLQAGVERIEALREDFIGRACALDETTRATPPRPGDWSALQVAQHLAIAEEQMLGHITKAAASGPNTPRPGLRGRLLVGMMCSGMRAAIPVPTPPNMAPAPEGPPLEVTEARWEDLRRQLREHLETVQDSEATFALHPLAGPLSALQVLAITEAHLIYHIKRFPAPRR